VRYFNSWFEELEQEDRENEKKYREDFLKMLNQKKQRRKKMSLLKSVESSMGLRKSMFGKQEKSKYIVKSIIQKG
jgi:hypothetical protein